jgi:hypothetical protein
MIGVALQVVTVRVASALVCNDEPPTFSRLFSSTCVSTLNLSTKCLRLATPTYSYLLHRQNGPVAALTKNPTAQLNLVQKQRAIAMSEHPDQHENEGSDEEQQEDEQYINQDDIEVVEESDADDEPMDEDDQEDDGSGMISANLPLEDNSLGHSSQSGVVKV